MTLLAGDGSDYDYSVLSCASDSSFNLPPLQEEEAQKGVFYKRAQRAPELRSIRNDTSLSSARKLHAIINVGGLRYQLPWTTLEDFPLSRLGQLHLCSSFDEIMCICDDYDVTHNEFFFDRSPSAFRTILTFLRAGKLRSLREMCALSFREELLYWGVPEESLEWCCRRRLLQRVQEFEAMERAEEEEELLEDLLDSDSGRRENATESRVNRCMGSLRDMVERPHSGLPGKIFACLSVMFVTITAVNLSISTMPAMREEEEAKYLLWMESGEQQPLLCFPFKQKTKNALLVFKCSTFTSCIHSGSQVQMRYVVYCQWVESETKIATFFHLRVTAKRESCCFQIQQADFHLVMWLQRHPLMSSPRKK